jgi:hypothetical protein
MPLLESPQEAARTLCPRTKRGRFRAGAECASAPFFGFNDLHEAVNE